MKWLPFILIAPIVIGLYFTGYSNGKRDCNEALLLKQAKVATDAARESQTNEDIIRTSPPSDDAVMAPVLLRTVIRVRGE